VKQVKNDSAFIKVSETNYFGEEIEMCGFPEQK